MDERVLERLVGCARNLREAQSCRQVGQASQSSWQRGVLQPVAMRMLAYVSQHPLELHKIPGAEPGSPALVLGDRL